jgi:hypothetical protein
MAIDTTTAGLRALEYVRNNSIGLFDPRVVSVKPDGKETLVVTVQCFGKPHYSNSGQLLPPPKVYQAVKVDAFDGSVISADTVG